MLICGFYAVSDSKTIAAPGYSRQKGEPRVRVAATQAADYKQ